jgi:uncharacterized glyoxalase superfamily protein PhnB
MAIPRGGAMSDARPNIFPVLRDRDADAAIDGLGRAFGFAEHMVHRGEDGTVAHAELRLGAGMVMLGQHRENGWLGSAPPDPARAAHGIYVTAPDPDALCDRARAAGAEITREPVDQPYGSREFGAHDLEGNMWSFGTYDPAAG